MNSTTTRPISPAIRAYLESGAYIVSPASCEGEDWAVIKNNGSSYVVDLAGTLNCSCRDFAARGALRACKHIELVKLHLAADAPAPCAPVSAEEAELTEEEAAQLTAELQRETDAEMARIRRERDQLWPDA